MIACHLGRNIWADGFSTNSRLFAKNKTVTYDNENVQFFLSYICESQFDVCKYKCCKLCKQVIRLDTIENPTRNYCISNFKFKSLKEIFSQDKTKANSHNMIICKVSIETCSLSKLIHDQLTENTIAFFQDMIAINFRTKLTMTPVSILSSQRIIL